MGNFPNFRGENKEHLKPPPSFFGSNCQWFLCKASTLAEGPEGPFEKKSRSFNGFLVGFFVNKRWTNGSIELPNWHLYTRIFALPRSSFFLPTYHLFPKPERLFDRWKYFCCLDFVKQKFLLEHPTQRKPK